MPTNVDAIKLVKKESAGIRSDATFEASMPYPHQNVLWVRMGYKNRTGEVTDDFEVYLDDLRELNLALKEAGFAIV